MGSLTRLHSNPACGFYKDGYGTRESGKGGVSHVEDRAGDVSVILLGGRHPAYRSFRRGYLYLQIARWEVQVLENAGVARTVRQNTEESALLGWKSAQRRPNSESRFLGAGSTWDRHLALAPPELGNLPRASQKTGISKSWSAAWCWSNKRTQEHNRMRLVSVQSPSTRLSWKCQQPPHGSGWSVPGFLVSTAA